MPLDLPNSVGPLSVVVPFGKGIEKNHFNANNVSKAVSLNDGPRAGQAWDIAEIFYNFPNAERDTGINEKGEKVEPVVEITVIITVMFGSIEVAKQEIIEAVPRPTTVLFGEMRPLHITGSLEPIIGQPLFGGQGLTVSLTFASEPTATSVPRMKSGDTGTFIVRYSRLTGKGRGHG